MSGTNGLPPAGGSNRKSGSDECWYVVAGFRGDVSADSADTVVVRATDIEQALELARRAHPGFHPVSALEEAQLREFLRRIDRQKASSTG